MDKPHKQIVTTYPIALKFGQTRLHVASPIPWHARSEAVQCPDCKTVFIVTEGYPKLDFFNELKKQHDKHEVHPDYIASAPQWTQIVPCNDCGM